MNYHCALCSQRPPANLTIFEDTLYRPECIAAEVDRRVSARHAEALAALRHSIAPQGEGSTFRPAGALRVVPGGKTTGAGLRPKA